MKSQNNFNRVPKNYFWRTPHYYKKIRGKIMNENEFLNKHWFTYHRLEDEFLEIEKTIPVDIENSNTFSWAYMKLLGSICAELSGCFKNFAKFNGKDYDSINQYKQFINDTFPDFIATECSFYKLGCEVQYLRPFANWTGDNNPFWWKTNNKIKHRRNDIEEGQIIENYKLANQNCILTALIGLYQLNIYFYTNIKRNSTSFQVLLIPENPSKIFNIRVVT